jgi:cation diffusion facilitator CzcD-associated flavoprotein CzcO
MSSSAPVNVAVIGGGVSGLAAAKYLLAEGLHVTLFEGRSQFGGVWTGEGFVRREDSLMYDGLGTNVTQAMMTLTDQPWEPSIPLFPRDADVKKYIQDYAESIPTSRNGVETFKCHFDTKVVDVRYSPKMWRVTTTKSGGQSSRSFAGVVVAAGNQNTPKWPAGEPDREDWIKHNPGSISHACDYKSADRFKNEVSHRRLES